MPEGEELTHVSRLTMLFLCGLVFIPTHAVAALTSWEFTGEVTTTQVGPLTDLFPAGTVVQFSVPIDSAATDSCPEPNSGFYSLPGSTLTYRGRSNQSAWTAFEVKSPAGNCGGGNESALRLIGFDRAGFSAATIGWREPQLGDAIPPPPLADPDVWFFISYQQVVVPTVRGRITSVRVVPEPTPLLTLGATALIGLLRRYGHRRRSSAPAR